MAGTIVISSIQLDSGNDFTIVSNTGTTLVSANGSGLNVSTSLASNSITSDKIVSVANTKISGNIVSSQITSVANTQLTGTVTNAQVGASVYEGIGYRNRIINGDMRIDQRNAGANTVIATAGFVIDRWKYETNQASKFTAGRNYGGVTPPTGFTNYLGYKTTTAYTVTSSDYFLPEHFIEGYNVADFGWGTANAKTVTLSFWVYSSVTGNHGAVISDGGATRVYPFLYAINSSNTWEYKQVTIPGETSGTGWTTDNTTGIQIRFSLGTGSSLTRTPNVWATDGGLGATGQVNIVETLNATWYVTGVQLEVGSVATPFERRPYGTELALCQRYFHLHSDSTNKALGAGAAVSTAQVSGIVYFPVSMRASPTIYSTLSATNKFRFNSNVNANSDTNMELVDAGLSFAGYSVEGFSGLTTGYAGAIRRFSATGVLGFTAEL